jgi:hypothetical protein
MDPTKTILALLVIVGIALAYTDPTSCTGSTQFYDPVLLRCTTCPANTVRASDFSYCNCSTSHYPNPDAIGFNSPASCLSLPSAYNPATQIASIYAVDGSLSPAVVTCANGYPNSLNQRCIPCGAGMSYSSTLGCQCTAANQYAINGQCYSSIASWTVTQSTPADILGEQQVHPL